VNFVIALVWVVLLTFIGVSIPLALVVGAGVYMFMIVIEDNNDRGGGAFA
jgi:branched-subunit amino acid transport protein AzlD